MINHCISITHDKLGMIRTVLRHSRNYSSLTVPNVHSTLDTIRDCSAYYKNRKIKILLYVGKIRSLHTTVEITMYEISVGLRQKNKKVLLVCSLVPYRTLHIPNYYSTEE